MSLWENFFETQPYFFYKKKMLYKFLKSIINDSIVTISANQIKRLFLKLGYKLNKKIR